jgi:hypothetical protein
MLMTWHSAAKILPGNPRVSTIKQMCTVVVVLCKEKEGDEYSPRGGGGFLLFFLYLQLYYLHCIEKGWVQKLDTHLFITIQS